MTITKSKQGEKIILALKGRLDVNTSLSLQQALIPAFEETKEIELAFAELEYVSSAGLRVLVAGQKTAKAKGATMTITGVSQEVMEVFEMTALDSVFTIL
jgi:anti-anti-sigma factor